MSYTQLLQSRTLKINHTAYEIKSSFLLQKVIEVGPRATEYFVEAIRV